MNENLNKIPGADDVCEKRFLKSIEAEPLLKEKYCKFKFAKHYSFNLFLKLNFKDDAFLDLEVMEIMEFCKKAITSVKSPHVFSHSDFNRGNRLVKETKEINGNHKKEIYLGKLKNSFLY